jgi:hypothetical protein
MRLHASYSNGRSNLCAPLGKAQNTNWLELLYCLEGKGEAAGEAQDCMQRKGISSNPIHAGP